MTTSGRHALLIFVLLCAALAPRPSAALPVFARIYNKPCGTCHTTFPQLNPAGEDFRAHGFHSLKPEIKPLRAGPIEVPGTLPLAIYLSVGEDLESKHGPGRPTTTKTLFNLESLKILGGGELGPHLGFMLEYEPLETEFDEGYLKADVPPYVAYLNAHAERWGWLGTVKGGWYELPLTVSPSVHRLSARPYLIYGINACNLLGTNPPGKSCDDLAVLGQEQIGADFNAIHQATGLALSAGFTNGSNREVHPSGSQDAYLHVVQPVGPMRPGFFLSYTPDLLGHGRDHVLKLGPDIDVYSRRFRLLGQFLAGHESNPTGHQEALWYYGGFLEANYRLTTSLVALSRADVAWLPRFDDRSRGGDTTVRRKLWEFTGGVQWSIEENVKLVAEVTYAEDHGLEGGPVNAWIGTLRLVTAFWPFTPPFLSPSIAGGGSP